MSRKAQATRHLERSYRWASRSGLAFLLVSGPECISNGSSDQPTDAMLARQPGDVSTDSRVGCVPGPVDTSGLVVASALTLSTTSPKRGDTVTAQITYENPGTKAISVNAIVIAGRPPGGTNGGGPYRDFAPTLPAQTIAAGAKITVTANLTIGTSDPTGGWYAYGTYQDSDGAWHDGATVAFDVSAAVTACDALPVGRQRGVNLIEGPIQNVHDANPGYAAQLAQIKDAGFNVVRAVMDWGAYDDDPSGFVAGLKSLADAADQAGLCVLYDNHQWSTSKSFGGDGFPTAFTAAYGDEATFWADYWNNAISRDGKNVWDLQYAYLEKVVATVDARASTLGYEILNEPRVDTCEQFAKLGSMHTSIGARLRARTSKAIHFDRASNLGCTQWNDPALETQIRPANVPNVVYHPHIYAPGTPLYPTCGPTSCQPELSYEVALGQAMGAPVFVGEWGQLEGGQSQSLTDTYVAEMKKAGVGWAYWSWDPVWQYAMKDLSYQNTENYTYVVTSLATMDGTP